MPLEHLFDKLDALDPNSQLIDVLASSKHISGSL